MLPILIFPSEISENNEVFFSIQIWSCPPLPHHEFEVHGPLVKKQKTKNNNFCFKGSVIQPSVDQNRLPPTCLTPEDDISPSPASKFAPVIGFSQSPAFWLGKAWSSQPICSAPMAAMTWIHRTNGLSQNSVYESLRQPSDFLEFSYHCLILENNLMST